MSGCSELRPGRAEEMTATCVNHVGDEGERGAHLLCVSTDTLLSVSITRGTRAAVVSVVHSRRGLSLLLVFWHPRG